MDIYCYPLIEVKVGWNYTSKKYTISLIAKEAVFIQFKIFLVVFFYVIYVLNWVIFRIIIEKHFFMPRGDGILGNTII